MLISQHTSAVRWRLGYATASQGQDQARVKESRYVIKVMKDKTGWGLEIPWSVRTKAKGCTAPFNWLIKTTVHLIFNIAYHNARQV